MSIRVYCAVESSFQHVLIACEGIRFLNATPGTRHRKRIPGFQWHIRKINLHGSENVCLGMVKVDVLWIEKRGGGGTFSGIFRGGIFSREDAPLRPSQLARGQGRTASCFVPRSLAERLSRINPSNILLSSTENCFVGDINMLYPAPAYHRNHLLRTTLES